MTPELLLSQLVRRLRMGSLSPSPPVASGRHKWYYFFFFVVVVDGCGRVDPGKEKLVKNVNLLKISGISSKKANVVLLP